MTAEQAISDISALSIEDQLRVVRAIWGSLPESVAPPNRECALRT